MKLPLSMSAKPAHACQRGFSLIELMIVMVITLMMSIAVFVVLSTSEGQKRTMTTTNDTNQSGNYAIYQIDKAIRQAGSGYGYTWQSAFGCELFANLTGQGVILPTTGTTLAAPFTALAANLNGIFRLAPIVIASGATTPNMSGSASDALIVMSGTAGFGEMPVTLTAATASQLTMTNTVSFGKNDLALIVNDTTSSGPTPCIIEEVSSTTAATATTLPLAGSYFANPIGTASLTTMTISAVSAVVNIGNAANPPLFQMIGVGNNNILYSYDLMQGGTFNTSLPIVDSVFELHALYGIANGAGVSWVSPATAPYDVATLENGSAASVLTLSTIKMIRIGLIMRTALPEKTAVTPGPLALFSDLGGAMTYTRALAAAEQNYRYRTIEATIPIRNSLMLTSQ